MHAGKMTIMYKNPDTDVYQESVLVDVVSQLRKAARLDAVLDINTIGYDVKGAKFVPTRITARLMPEHQKMVKVHLHNRRVLHTSGDTEVFTTNRSWVRAKDLRPNEDKVISAGVNKKLGVDQALPLKVLKVEDAGMGEAFEVVCDQGLWTVFVETILVKPTLTTVTK